MNITRVSATKARNNFFTLLDQVSQGVQIIIEKDGRETAIILPRQNTTNWKNLLKVSRETAGIDKDFLKEGSLLREKGAGIFLGSWDNK